MGLISGIVALTVTSCACAFSATILHLVSFSTDEWLASNGASPFTRIGFHQACFDRCRHPYCPANDPEIVFTGCWWLNDYYVQEIHTWLTPDWFMFCRNLAIANIPLTFVSCILLAVASCYVVDDYPVVIEPRSGKQRGVVAILFITAAFLFASIILALLTLTTFYANTFHYDWMPMPTKNYLGYSYWLEVTAAIFLGVAFVMSTLGGTCKLLIMLSTKPLVKYMDEMMLGKFPIGQPTTWSWT